MTSYVFVFMWSFPRCHFCRVKYTVSRRCQSSLAAVACFCVILPINQLLLFDFLSTANAPWLPSLQRSAALVAPLVFIYSFGYFSSRKTKEAFKTMPNSPLATAMLHNMEIYKKYGTRGVPQTDDSARPMSTT